jgi:nucleoside-diphosphate-sugar epimerase
MVRTLVTGAAGFTGRYVTRSLGEQDHDVHALVHHLEHECGLPKDHVHQADLVDLGTVSRVIERVQPDYIVHLAAIAFVAHDDVEQMYRTNIAGTRQLLEAASNASKTPSSIVLASSANVYGNARQGALDESLSPAPANDYGVTKAAMEYVAALYSSKLPLTVVRPFNYTGRGQSPNFIIPKIVAHVRERLPVIELGNLDVARDFSDVRCVAEIYARVLTTPEAIGQTYNICSGRAISLGEMIDLASQLSGHRFEVRVNPAFVRENEVKSLWGSAAKLESVLGPLPAMPFEETLRWMLEE